MNWLYALHLLLRLAFIFLVYYSLFYVLEAVRREMLVHTRRAGSSQGVATMGSLQVVHSGGDPQLMVGQRLALQGDTLIGSAESCDITLKAPFVSGQHARIWYSNNEWLLEDVGSRNGTLLNHRACPPRTPHTVRPHLPIQIGDVVLELVA